jgi:hypothetical protein
MASNQRFWRRHLPGSLRTWLAGSSADPDASTAAVLGSIYLLLISLVDIFGYTRQTLPLGVASSVRALLMLLVLALWPSAQYLSPFLDRPRRWMFLVPALLGAFESVRSISSPYHMHAAVSAIIACIALTFAVASPKRIQDRTRRARWCCVAAILCVCFASAALRPKVFDVAYTSISAIKAMSMHLNPYALNLDKFGELNTGDERFTGYKYSPLLPIIYFPFVKLFGDSGIVLANSIALAITALTVYALCREFWNGNGQWAAMLFLASPLIGMNVIVYQTNDLLAVLPICVGFLVWNSRPGLAGFLLGASASIKVLPAPIAMALLLPSDLQTARRFVVGIGVGLIPIIVFAALNPMAFFDNVVLFEIVRPPFPSSWLLHMPSIGISLLRAGFVVTFLATAIAALIHNWSIERRITAYIVLTVGLLLTSPINQDYYWLWWIPLFIPVLCAVGRVPQNSDLNRCFRPQPR